MKYVNIFISLVRIFCLICFAFGGILGTLDAILGAAKFFRLCAKLKLPTNYYWYWIMGSVVFIIFILTYAIENKFLSK